MRLWTSALLAACSYLGTAADHLVAGRPAQAQVAVIRDGDRELKRTAHRLKIPAGQLQQARIALREATQSLHEVEVERLGEGKQIPPFWLRLHRGEAVPSLQALLTARSREVPRLENAARYEKLLRWAVEVVSRMAELDPSRGLQALQSWPAPQEWMGDSAGAFFDELHSEMAGDDFSQRFSENASRAIRNLLHSSSSSSRYMSELSRIQQTQDSEKANRLVDKILSELRQSSDFGQLQRWTNLARRAGNLPHDRYSDLIEAVILANSRMDPGPSAGQTFIY
ncbi:MAG: hypothetical protein V3T83_05910, partial [Acidobacteriota bacterium]